MSENIADRFRTSILSLKKIGEYVKRIGSFSSSGNTVANELEIIDGKIGDFTDPSETVSHKLENLIFDTTGLAKQGEDTGITLTSVNVKLGNVVMMTAQEKIDALADLDTHLV